MSESGNGGAYQWYDSRSGSMSYPIYFGGTWPAMYYNVSHTNYCSTTFYTNALGFTTDYKWAGNACKAYNK